MSHQFAEIMFTDSVKAAQEQNGSRARLERFAEMSGPNDELTEREAGFIAQRDTFYMATMNEDDGRMCNIAAAQQVFCVLSDRGVSPTQTSVATRN